MKGMFLLSTAVHFLFFALFIYFPELNRKEVVLTPVYTVDLLSMPETQAPPASSMPPKAEPTPKEEPKPAPPPEEKSKPPQFEPSLPAMETLKKLEKFEKKAEKAKEPEKKKEKIKEKSLSQMLTEFEKKWEKEKSKESGEKPPVKAEKQKDVLEKLAVLENQWNRSEEQKKEESKKATPAPSVEKPSPAKVDKQMKLGRTKLESQTSAPELPSHLNRYYALILSRINEKWMNPLSTKLSDSKLEIPGVAFFEIKANGEVSNVRVEESSGDAILDSLVRKAIEDASPLPPPPGDAFNGSMNVYLDFRYILEK